jgi:CheY-like chemotaxis protein
MEQGINGYLTKPLRQNELKNVIKTVSGFVPHKETISSHNPIDYHTIAERNTKNPPRILLVEDYPTNQQVATMHMEKAGFIVELAENGKQAVLAYKSRSYDIVLMDIQMPEMDGYEATHLIRKFDEGKDSKTPIIAMTAYASKEDREKCMAAGMNDFITKPLRRKELLGTIDKWLDINGGSVDDTSSENSIVSDTIEKKTETSPVDFDLALDELRCTEEFLMKVLESFAGSASEKINQIGAAIAMDDFNSIGKESHALKGSAATIFANKLAEIAYKLQKAAEDGNKEKINNYFIDFQKEFERFTTSIKERQ